MQNQEREKEDGIDAWIRIHKFAGAAILWQSEEDQNPSDLLQCAGESV